VARRVGLLVARVLHVLMAWQLTRITRRARPSAYERPQPQVSTLASRTMRWGGVLLLVFIVFHILHFTTGTVFPDREPARRAVSGVQHTERVRQRVSAFPVRGCVRCLRRRDVCSCMLHLFHGAWSSVRTLGLAKPSPEPLHRRLATAIALVVWLGFTAVPVAVFFGVIR
jgi:succinate dehydrogenase / fumarate reductase cytochrome b subunit